MFSSLKNQIIFYSWWLLWAMFHFWLLDSLDWDLSVALTESLTSTFILSLFCFSLSFTMRYYRPSDIKVAYLFLWAAAFSIIWGYITRWIVTFLDNQAYLEFFDLTMPLRLITGFLIMATFICILYVFFGQLSRQEQEKMKADIDKLARDTELSALRDQLQPHFLFNTLNSIHALVNSKPELAQKMILQLSDFLRTNLKRDSNAFVTFGEEIKHLSLYLDIEKVRFGHRLNIDIHAEDVTKTKMIPSLLLQPLIENSIKYGLYDTLDNVTITLNAFVKENELQITITNPFDPESRGKRKGTGFGLNSTRRRLFLLYGRTDLFETEISDKLFKVKLQVPQT